MNHINFIMNNDMVPFTKLLFIQLTMKEDWWANIMDTLVREADRYEYGQQK